MKLSLVPIILLLIPAAFADLPAPTAKILLDGDYVISESFDARSVRYEYEGDVLIVEIKSNNSKQISEFMHLRRKELQEQKLSFAIEAYPETDGLQNQTFCRLKSSEGLRHLIEKCFAKIVLRELSEEERKQIQEFKEHEKGTQSSFKLVYKKRAISTKTVGLKSFEFRDFRPFAKSDFIVFVDNYHPNSKYIRMIGFLTEKSFVVENLAKGIYKCHHTGLSDLKPVECNGLIKLRGLTADD